MTLHLDHRPFGRTPRVSAFLTLALWLPIVWLFAGCTAAQTNKALTSPAGALFCRVQLAGGGALVVAVADAAAAQATGPAAPFAIPVALLATGATKQFVDQACQAAAAVLAAKAGVPVPPPAVPVPVVPIVPPTA